MKDCEGQTSVPNDAVGMASGHNGPSLPSWRIPRSLQCSRSVKGTTSQLGQSLNRGLTEFMACLPHSNTIPAPPSEHMCTKQRDTPSRPSPAITCAQEASVAPSVGWPWPNRLYPTTYRAFRLCKAKWLCLFILVQCPLDPVTCLKLSSASTC